MPEIEKKIVLLLIIVYYLLWLLMGLFYYLKPPRKINSLYGYRTTRSMESLENWHYANSVAARFMLIITHVVAGVSLVYFFLFKDMFSFTATFLPINFFYCFSLICIIPIVETKLKRFEAKQKSVQE